MKQGLQEINHIISICDKISDYISKNGTVSRWTGGELYNDYRDAIKAFFDSRPDIDKPENAFRAVIQAFLYNPSSNYTLNMSEITVIRSTLTGWSASYPWNWLFVTTPVMVSGY